MKSRFPFYLLVDADQALILCNLVHRSIQLEFGVETSHQAVRLRSGRRLLAPAPPRRQEGRQRRCRPRRCTADLSGLPEDILLEILARLRDVRQAARTSVLSRGWRRLWTRLPKMYFHVATGPADTVGGARFNFHRFGNTDLSINDGERGKVDPARLTAALRIAAHIAPTKLNMKVRNLGLGLGVTFELPCFEATTSINLFCFELKFTLPPVGVFASLEHLDILNCICDPCHLLDRCPRLRRLNLSSTSRWSADGPLTIRSASLEELNLQSGLYENGEHKKRHVDFATPALRKLRWIGAEEVAVLQSMPMAEDVSMLYRLSAPVRFGNHWALERLDIGSKHPAAAGRHVLALWIEGDRESPVERSFAQEIAGLPRALNFSVLELNLRREGHVRGAGALVFEVLMICPVQTLELWLLDDLVPKCSDTCDCDQVSNGTSQQVSLTLLEVVQIEGFRCAHHEIDLLKLLFRSAPMLKRMTVYVHHTTVSLDGQRHELHTIFQANASVECDVYDRCGEKILLA